MTLQIVTIQFHRWKLGRSLAWVLHSNDQQAGGGCGGQELQSLSSKFIPPIPTNLPLFLFIDTKAMAATAKGVKHRLE